jgi:hypothetical protein
MKIDFRRAHKRLFVCLRDGCAPPVSIILPSDEPGAGCLVDEAARCRATATQMSDRAELLMRAARQLEPEAFDLTLTPEEQRLAELIDDQAAWARAQAAEEAQP